MTTPVEQLSFIPTTANTRRSLADWTGDVINVKNFGAVGDNSTDDAAAIQAAFNAAFGTYASPHGNGGGYLNKPVFFPAGRYKILTPVSVRDVWGGRIFGAGALCSTIDYQGTVAPISSNPNDSFCPTLWLNDCNFCEISDLSLKGPADTTNHTTVCLWFGPDGVGGHTGSHGNLISNVTTSVTSYGIIHGSDAGQAISENTHINCGGGDHEIGIYISGANTLNMRIIGGQWSGCTTAGIKTNNNGMAQIIQDVAFDANLVDIDLASGSEAIITGMRTESGAFVKQSGSGPVTLINCQQACRQGIFTGSTNGTTLTCTAMGTLPAFRRGMIITGTDGVDSLPSTYPVSQIVRQISGTAWGTGDYELSIAASPGNINAGTSLTAVAAFLNLGAGSANTTLIGCGGAYNVAIIGQSSTNVFIHDNEFFDQIDVNDIATNLFTWYSGQVMKYDLVCRGTPQNIVSALPTAATKFSGLRMFVTDATVTAVSSNFGTTVAGTGANTVPVFCNGSNWIIG